eukprot:tig00000880_g5199.t1
MAGIAGGRTKPDLEHNLRNFLRARAKAAASGRSLQDGGVARKAPRIHPPPEAPAASGAAAHQPPTHRSNPASSFLSTHPAGPTRKSGPSPGRAFHPYGEQHRASSDPPMRVKQEATPEWGSPPPSQHRFSNAPPGTAAPLERFVCASPLADKGRTWPSAPSSVASSAPSPAPPPFIFDGVSSEADDRHYFGLLLTRVLVTDEKASSQQAGLNLCGGGPYPSVMGARADLYRLYRQISLRAGFERVIEAGSMLEVAQEYDGGRSAASAHGVLAMELVNLYRTYLLPFERLYLRMGPAPGAKAGKAPAAPACREPEALRTAQKAPAAAAAPAAPTAAAPEAPGRLRGGGELPEPGEPYESWGA